MSICFIECCVCCVRVVVCDDVPFRISVCCVVVVSVIGFFVAFSMCVSISKRSHACLCVYACF